MRAEELTVPVTAPAPLREKRASVRDYGADPAAADNYGAFQKALDDSRERGVSTLSVPPGIYRFATARPLCLRGLEDFTLDGNGAELIFSRDEDFVHVSDCRRVVLRDLVVDWDWGTAPLASVAHVRGTGPTRDWVDLEFTEHDTVDADMTFATMNALDPQRLTPGCEGGREHGRGFSRVRKAGANVLRCHLDLDAVSELLFTPGSVYLVRHFLHDSPAFTISDCRHLSLQRITVHSAPGAGFIVHGDTANWEAVGCRIALRPGATRRITTTSDGMHLAQSRGFCRLEGCDFSFHGDDCLNIHDNISMGLRDVRRQSLIARNVREDARPLHAGDPVELRRPDLSPTGFASHVTDVRYLPDDECELAFADVLPPNLDPQTILFNRRYDSSHYLIRGNHFHENRARGVLLQACHGLVEGNRFYRNQGAAVQIETGASLGMWSEGMGVEDLIVRDNTFDTCDVNDWGKAVVYLSAFLPAGVPVTPQGSPNPTSTIGDSGSLFRTAYPIFRDLLFENNRFVDYPRRAMIISSARDVTVRGNTFSNPTSRAQNNPERGSIWVELSSRVTISGNDWQPSPYQAERTVEWDPATASGVTTTD
ncbi:MAG: right-handed parallel beta-helix repeat-containing protein [Spirochaetaceae bacterium]|nr:right-handed parallel beta-helix repeat-containing protein [Spirochaetaceae bacterium]